ncbi:MAG: pseudouridine synthase [Lysobacteraceae bacterium]|nr:MAG: pseudouridine synthase [Xanthomonadaceae bacterium]
MPVAYEGALWNRLLSRHQRKQVRAGANPSGRDPRGAARRRSGTTTRTEPVTASDDIGASRLQVPPGAWSTLLDCLCERFPAISREAWRDRFARGRVMDASGAPIGVDAPHRAGSEIRYFREVEDEPAIPFEESVLHVDEHLVVADKPHFLPVTPAGRFVRETLLARLTWRLGNPDLVPLHRIDRDTAGLVLFSANRETRNAYQSLFRLRRVAKAYEAIAPALPGRVFPLVHASRLRAGDPFFRMREVDGPADSETRVDVVERAARAWRYSLEPVTGRKHQLRVHMAALGAPIANDRLYPELERVHEDDYARPLQLLARRLAFVDPLSGATRCFESVRRLDPP